MKIKLERHHWEQARQDNINLILRCKMQIEMAEKILLLIAGKLSQFPIKKPKSVG